MAAPKDHFILDCETYEDYLDSLAIPEDHRLLRNRKAARRLVLLGHRSKAVYTPEQFKKRKEQLRELLFPSKKSAVLFSAGIRITDPVLQALAARETLNQTKVFSTVVFVKYRCKRGFEISGYIDYEQSLRLANSVKKGVRDWAGIFAGRVPLKPTPRDLSYYDWHKNIVHQNSSDNYVIHHDVKYGLSFMHRSDHKNIYVGRVKKGAPNSVGTRSTIFSNTYGYVVFYDYKVFRRI